MIEIRKDNSIFVSIASYRDKDTVNTVYDCFQKAKYPEKVFIGVCQQNKDDDEDIYKIEKLEPYKNNIRILRIPYFKAKGPTYARFLCSGLNNGETYYLQIDSHTRFIQDWDDIAINMLNKCGQNAVLSYYPKEITDTNLETVPRICRANFNHDSIISFDGASLLNSPLNLVKVPFIAAGFFFTYSDFLNSIPFDPYLPNLFVGEEILLSVRFWTHGWDIYSPDKNIIFHHYTRSDEPKVWNDKKFDSQDAMKKVKYYLKMIDKKDVPEKLQKELDRYGLGKIRSIEDYYKFAGIDVNNKKINKNFCDTIENFTIIQKKSKYNHKLYIIITIIFYIFFILLSLYFIYKISQLK
jgi:[Skp1-protein]-hydroxyproline N-acetylglucosaminyltransferase